MPSFDCPECSDSFNSRQKRNEHILKEHDDIDEPSDESNAQSSTGFGQKKLAAILFGTLMIGLPLGAGVFYASFSPNTNNPSGPGNSDQFNTNPPVGNRYAPQEGTLPSRAVSTEPLSKENQVYTLLFGGSQQVRGGAQPAALLQYSCTDCQNLITQLEDTAQAFNSGGTMVYVAPYPDMDATIALTTFRARPTKYDSFDRDQIEQDLCNRLGQMQVSPLRCIEDSLGTNSTKE